MRCFRFVDDHRTDHPVKRLCELVEVPRSSFYEWVSRPLSEHYVADAWLANDIYDIHVASPSVTTPQPRPTLPPKPRDSHQPVSNIAGQLHSLVVAWVTRCYGAM